MAASRTKLAVLVPPRDAARVETPRGTIAFWELGPRIYATHVDGHLSPEMARLIIERGEPLYRSGRVSGFHSWFGMSNYDSSCRAELTAWVMRHREQSLLHIGLTSRFVAMGVAVANLALGNIIHVHGDLMSLEAALAEALNAPR